MASSRPSSFRVPSSSSIATRTSGETETPAKINVISDSASLAAGAPVTQAEEQLLGGGTTAQATSTGPTTTPRISPFFTLVASTSPATGTTTFHHPHVHYVFSDDTTDLTTEASLRALDSLASTQNRTAGSSAITTTETTPSNSHTRRKENSQASGEEEGVEQTGEGEGEDGRKAAQSSLLPPKKEGIEERYIILDMDENGEKVIGVRSMASDWAVTGVEIEAAPIWGGGGRGGAGRDKAGGSSSKTPGGGVGTGDGNEAEETDEDGVDGQQGLMLKVEGVEAGVETAEIVDGDVNEALKVFQRNLEGLRKAVEGSNLQRK